MNGMIICNREATPEVLPYRPVWLILDSATECITEPMREEGIDDSLVFFADDPSLYEKLKRASESGAPEYAVLLADCDATAFTRLCNEIGATPVLATLKGGKNNEAVREGKNRFIDLDSLSSSVPRALFCRLLADLPEIISPKVPPRKAKMTTENCYSGKLTLGRNRVKDGKYLVFSARLDSMTEGARLIIGHGYMMSYGYWIEISDGKIKLSCYHSWHDPQVSVKLDAELLVEVKDYITVFIARDADNKGNTLTVSTGGGVYTKSGIPWTGCEGEIFAEWSDMSLSEATLSWTCVDYDKPIWFVGASYYSLDDPARWPYYTYRDGYSREIFITGRGGMNGMNGHEELHDALKYGKPEYAVWGIGMNDGADSDEDINPKTLRNKTEFLRICKENGIKPVFMSIPNCRINNTHKLDYVMNRRGEFAKYDYTVIDLAHSVNAYESFESFETGYTWYKDTLTKDGVHPTSQGAKNFYMQMLVDFPYIVTGVRSEVSEFHRSSLTKNRSLTLGELPSGGEYAFLLSVNYDGDLQGSIDLSFGDSSFMSIDESTLSFYTVSRGEKTLVAEADNPLSMKEMLMMKLHVRDGKVSFGAVSSTETDPEAIKNRIFSLDFEMPLCGKVKIKAKEIPLSRIVSKVAVANG